MINNPITTNNKLIAFCNLIIWIFVCKNVSVNFKNEMIIKPIKRGIVKRFHKTRLGQRYRYATPVYDILNKRSEIVNKAKYR